MTDAKQRLTHLIELATADAPENRRMLAVELCDLLLDWPAHYPAAMREPFEALLEKTVRVIDAQTRQMLAQKLGAHGETPIALLNEFYFDTPQDSRDAIVLRNALVDSQDDAAATDTDESALIAAARGKPQDQFTDAFAQLLGIERKTADSILHDQSGRALAVACKGAHLGRATFSALAIITKSGTAPDTSRERLSSFDSIPVTGAERLLTYWRSRSAA
jgi:DNA-binding XRE family transcriptional regulator